MRSCEFCRSEVPDNASFCGVCGREVRSSPQSMRGNGNSVIPGQNIPGSGSNVPVSESPGRSTRRPYQFSPQLYQDQKGADVPTVAYSPRASVVSPMQQVPYYSSACNGQPRRSEIPYCTTSTSHCT